MCFMGMSFEFLVICLSCSTKNFTIGLKCLIGDRSAFSVYAAVKTSLLEFDTFRKIKMIVTDTASVNTGLNSGAIKRISDEMKPAPAFFPCQLHVMDRSLKIFIQQCYEGEQRSTSPEINLDIVEDITKTFSTLLVSYHSNVPCNATSFTVESVYLRGDYNYLYLLWKAFSSGQDNPKIDFKLPPSNDARWNSKASFFFMAWFLLPGKRSKISNVVQYLNEIWCPNWFKCRHQKLNFEQISTHVSNDKLKQFFLKHHTTAKPVLNVPLTNEIAERSLGRLDFMQHPRGMFTGTFKELSTENKTTLRQKLEQFEKKFLSFVNSEK